MYIFSSGWIYFYLECLVSSTTLTPHSQRKPWINRVSSGEESSSVLFSPLILLFFPLILLSFHVRPFVCIYPSYPFHLNLTPLYVFLHYGSTLVMSEMLQTAIGDGNLHWVSRQPVFRTSATKISYFLSNCFLNCNLRYLQKFILYHIWE